MDGEPQALHLAKETMVGGEGQVPDRTAEEDTGEEIPLLRLAVQEVVDEVAILGVKETVIHEFLHQGGTILRHVVDVDVGGPGLDLDLVVCLGEGATIEFPMTKAFLEKVLLLSLPRTYNKMSCTCLLSCTASKVSGNKNAAVFILLLWF